MDNLPLSEEQIANINILELFGLEKLPEQQKTVFLESLSDLAIEHIVGKIFSKLPPKKRERFNKIFDNPDAGQEKEAFFQEYAPNLAEMVVEEIFNLKKEAFYLATRLKELAQAKHANV